MSSIDFSNVLKRFLPDLLYDLSVGHGDDQIEAPVCDEGVMDAITKAEYEELLSFWGGAKSVRKFDLFTAILGYCMDDTLLNDITTCVSAHYPKLTPKLDVNGLKNLFQKTVGDATAAIIAQPADIVDEAPPVVKTGAFGKPDKVVPPAPVTKAGLSKSPSKANSPEYQAFVASKRETDAMRHTQVV